MPQGKSRMPNKIVKIIFENWINFIIKQNNVLFYVMNYK
jgi:hypothetical protein